MTEAKLYSRIADPNISTNDLVVALRQLNGQDEELKIWRKIADDKTFSIAHRRLAIGQMFYRYFRPGMTVSDLAVLLNQPRWLKREDIRAIGYGAAWPVEWKDGNTHLVIFLLPEDPPEGQPQNRFMFPQVYLIVEGDVGADELYNCLSGKDCAKEGRRIFEIGSLWPPEMNFNTWGFVTNFLSNTH